MEDDIPGECPSPIQLGQSGWNILHSSAAVYPYHPSSEQKKAMNNFIHSWSYVYACNWCAYHMRQYVKQNPPDVTDKLTVTRYLCEFHNVVNDHLGKDQYDCDPMKVLKRWHPRFPDGMADMPSMEERMAAEERKMAMEALDRQQRREAEESRLSMFGRGTGAARREPSTWRPGASAEAPMPEATSNSGKRWWFWGNAAYTGAKTESASPAASVGRQNTTAPPAPAAASKNAASSSQKPLSTPSPAASGSHGLKVNDDEVDVDAVLRRLKACQVYCPEDESVQH